MTESDKIQMLMQEGEGLTVEFKEKYTSRIDRDIVAFANSKGGLILLGVDDKGNPLKLYVNEIIFTKV